MSNSSRIWHSKLLSKNEINKLIRRVNVQSLKRSYVNLTRNYKDLIWKRKNSLKKSNNSSLIKIISRKKRTISGLSSMNMKSNSIYSKIKDSKCTTRTSRYLNF